MNNVAVRNRCLLSLSSIYEHRSFLTPHSSFLTPHCSLLTPHLLGLLKDEGAGYDAGAFEEGIGCARELGADFYPVSEVARVGRDAAYL